MKANKNPFETATQTVDVEEVEKRKNEYASVLWTTLCKEMLPMKPIDMAERYARSTTAEEKTKVAILGIVERCVAFDWDKTRLAEIKKVRDFLWKYGRIDEKRLGTGKGAVVSRTMGVRKTFVGKADLLEAQNEKNAFCRSFEQHYAYEFEQLKARSSQYSQERTATK